MESDVGQHENPPNDADFGHGGMGHEPRDAGGLCTLKRGKDTESLLDPPERSIYYTLMFMH